MKTLPAALLLSALVATPVTAQIVIDLPHLTWPDETSVPAEPATSSCYDPLLPLTAQACAE